MLQEGGDLPQTHTLLLKTNVKFWSYEKQEAKELNSKPASGRNESLIVFQGWEKEIHLLSVKISGKDLTEKLWQMSTRPSFTKTTTQFQQSLPSDWCEVIRPSPYPPNLIKGKPYIWRWKKLLGSIFFFVYTVQHLIKQITKYEMRQENIRWSSPINDSDVKSYQTWALKSAWLKC